MAMLENFTEMKCWRACQELKVFVIGISKKFPKEEKHDLTDNMRRGVRSTTRTITEGFGRHTHKDNSDFIKMSKG